MIALLASLLAWASPSARAADDPIDLMEQYLALRTFEGFVRTKVSGTVDLEGYGYNQLPPPALISSPNHWLFNPRLALFVDSQIGSKFYFFAQARVDRGFDPNESGARMRLDEYALRFTPWDDGRLSVQAGRFGTIVGNWVPRHLSWDNPFVTAPLIYENPTAIWDSEGPDSIATFLSWQYIDKSLNNPVIWGPSYATGISVAGRIGKFEYAAEIKNAGLSSRPSSWDALDDGFAHPAYAARVGYRPNEAWNLGLSYSRGPYMRPEAVPTLPAGRGVGRYQESMIAQDISYARGHFQFWAEFYEVRFQVPIVGKADTFGYYLEAKYKFTPQFYGALRWNQQIFSDIPDGAGGQTPWGRDIWRIDSAVGYRFTPHTQLKLQYNFQHETNGARDFGHTFASQFTLRF